MPLRIAVLADNNTLIDRYFLGEPGFSLFLEADGLRVLFDVGYSDVFYRNAIKKGIDLSHIDYVALSHGHEDHTWGLDTLARLYTELGLEKLPRKTPSIVAHPKTFASVLGAGIPESGPLFTEQKMAKHFPVLVDTVPRWLSPNLVYLGEIPRLNDFEENLAFGTKEGSDEADPIVEDSALVYKAKDGLVVMVGCSHSGVCNTIEYARSVCGEQRVLDVIGGFHLQKPSQKRLEGTMKYFEALKPRELHACHCTDLASKIALSRIANVLETGSGLDLFFE